MPRLYPLVLLLTVLALPAASQSLWQWRDANGLMVYSDRPPPPSVPQRQILRQPVTGQDAMATPMTPPAAEPSPTQTSPTKSADAQRPAAPGKATGNPGGPLTPANPAANGASGADSRPPSRSVTAPSPTQQAQDDARLAAVRADNCLRARQSLAAIRAGQRMSRYTEQGERLFLDEAELAAETVRLEGLVQQDCR